MLPGGVGRGHAIPRDAEDRIVLLKRAFDPGTGLWTFPGGSSTRSHDHWDELAF